MKSRPRPRRPSDQVRRVVLQSLAPGLAPAAVLLGYLVLTGGFRDAQDASGHVRVAGVLFFMGAMPGGVLFLCGLDRIHPILRILTPAAGMIVLFLGTLLLLDAFNDPSLETLISWWLAPVPYALTAGLLVGGLVFLGARGRRGHSRITRALGWVVSILGGTTLVVLYLVTMYYAVMTSEMWW